MNLEQIERARELLAFCKTSTYKLKNYVLLQQTHEVKVGDQTQSRHDRMVALTVTVSAEAFKGAFAWWKDDLTKRYNAAVRELNQLGVTHEYRLL